jgi:broad specificity phosphatase PhoE
MSNEVSKPTKLLLIRHAPTVWAEVHRHHGWADPPLSEAGKEQARLAGKALRGIPFHLAFCSDLRRAVETAQVIASVAGVRRIEVDSDLRERNWGEWNGLTNEEIDGRWPGARRAVRHNELKSPPGGEPKLSFRRRAISSVERLGASVQGPTILVITHGELLKAVGRHFGDPSLRTPTYLAGMWLTRIDGEIRGIERISLIDQPEYGY